MNDTNHKNSEVLLTTAELANLLKKGQSTIRNSLSQNGHFWKVRPVRTPSGRILWPRTNFQNYFRCGGM